jgi:glutaconate CoA-transferase subunit A
MPMNKAQFVSLAEAADAIPSGSRFVIGGGMVMPPMSLVREMIRQGKKDLDLVCSPIGGINVDMLAGAGCARSVEFPQVSLGEFGMAPNFRRAVESGRLATREHS